MHAFCYASGEIDFGRRVPTGALKIASGPAKVLREKIEVAARHGYDGDTLLVPGVPEAENQTVAMDALIAWKNWRRDQWAAAGLSL